MIMACLYYAPYIIDYWMKATIFKFANQHSFFAKTHAILYIRAQFLKNLSQSKNYRDCALKNCFAIQHLYKFFARYSCKRIGRNTVAEQKSFAKLSPVRPINWQSHFKNWPPENKVRNNYIKIHIRPGRGGQAV